MFPAIRKTTKKGISWRIFYSIAPEYQRQKNEASSCIAGLPQMVAQG